MLLLLLWRWRLPQLVDDNFRSSLRHADWRITDLNNIYVRVPTGANFRITIPGIVARLPRILSVPVNELNEQERMELAIMYAAVDKAKKANSDEQVHPEQNLHDVTNVNASHFFANAIVLRALIGSDLIPSSAKCVVIATTPDQVLELKEAVALDERAFVSVLLVGKRSFLFGPIVRWSRWCEICMCSPAALSFNCFDSVVEFDDIVDTAIGVARLAQPAAGTFLRFADSKLDTIQYAPLVGCPRCACPSK